jgi:hypothetical protein
MTAESDCPETRCGDPLHCRLSEISLEEGMAFNRPMKLYPTFGALQPETEGSDVKGG